MRTRRLTNRTAGWAWPVVAVLLCLVLCSCSSEEDIVSSSPDSSNLPDGTPVALTFNVSTDGYGTRGIPLNSLSGQAGLLGYEYDKEEGWEDGQKPNMMYNEVMQGSGTTWQTSTTYAPNKDKTMRFYAYYPYQPYVAIDEDEYGNPVLPVDADGNEVNPIILMSGQDEAGIPYFDYISPLTADEQEDLMYAVSDEVNVNSATGKLDAITLQFHHLLSALALTITNGFDNGYIKEVIIDNICYMGHFSYDTEMWEVEENVEEIRQDIDVKVSTDDSSIKSLTGETLYFMLLPQQLNPNSVLTIIFNNGKKDFPISYALGTATNENGEPLEFKISKITTLNLNIESLTKMTVKCSVTDWGHGATFNGAQSDYPDILMEYGLEGWTPDLGLDAQNDTIVHDIVTGPQTITP